MGLKGHALNRPRRYLALYRAYALTGLALIATACAGTGPAESFLAHVEAGAHSSFDNRSFLVIESADEFAIWYRDLHAYRLPVPPAPRIDFRRYVALVALMGQRSSGGYGIRFPSSVLDGDTIKVTVVEQKPTPGTAQTTVMTNPYAIATIARGKLEKVAFVSADGQVLAVREIAPLGRE